MKVVKSRLVAPGWCVNVFGWLVTREPERLDAALVNHERIHTAQMRELLWLPFYVVYLLEWLWNMVRLRNWFKAYRAISFEREAYAHGHDLSYLKRRRRYAMWR